MYWSKYIQINKQWMLVLAIDLRSWLFGITWFENDNYQAHFMMFSIKFFRDVNLF